MSSNSDWKTKMMNDYLKWRKEEAIPTLPDDPVEEIMKDARSEKLKAYHDKKREDILNENPSYYEELKDQQNERNRERNRAYRETHRDAIKEINRQYREKNTEIAY